MRNCHSPLSVTLPGVAFFLCFVTTLKIDLGFSFIPLYALVMGMIVCYRERLAAQPELFFFEKLFLLFYAYCCLTFCHSFAPLYTFRFILGIILFLTTYFAIRAVLLRSAKSIISIFNYTFISYLILSFAYYLAGLWNMNTLEEGKVFYGLVIEKYVPRMQGFSHDPNIFAFSLFAPFFFFLINRGAKARLLSVFSFGLMLLSGSRGGMISLLFGLGVYLALWKKTECQSFISRIINILRRLSLRVTCSISVGILFFLVLLEQTRFVHARMRGLTTGAGRFEIWENALELFKMEWLVGYGAFSWRSLNRHFFNDSHFVHNTFIEVAVETGVIGLSLFCLALGCLLFKQYKIGKEVPELLFLFPSSVCALIALNGLSLCINPAFMFYILLCAVSTQYAD